MSLGEVTSHPSKTEPPLEPQSVGQDLADLQHINKTFSQEQLAKDTDQFLWSGWSILSDLTRPFYEGEPEPFDFAELAAEAHRSRFDQDTRVQEMLQEIHNARLNQLVEYLREFSSSMKLKSSVVDFWREGRSLNGGTSPLPAEFTTKWLVALAYSRPYSYSVSVNFGQDILAQIAPDELADLSADDQIEIQKLKEKHDYKLFLSQLQSNKTDLAAWQQLFIEKSGKHFYLNDQVPEFLTKEYDLEVERNSASKDYIKKIEYIRELSNIIEAIVIYLKQRTQNIKFNKIENPDDVAASFEEFNTRYLSQLYIPRQPGVPIARWQNQLEQGYLEVLRELTIQRRFKNEWN